MRSAMRGSEGRGVALAALALGLAVPACNLAGREDEGEVLARQTIGPEGGEIAGGGLRAVFPPGALFADTEIEIRASKVDLSARDYNQQDNARALFPDDLALRQPVAITYNGADAVLFQQDGLKVAVQGDTGYINELGISAASSAGSPRVTALEPILGRAPQDAGATLVDRVHYRLEVRDATDLAVSMTIYDTADAYDKPLNGTGTGECGFRLEVPIGASFTQGCTEGFVTAGVRTASPFIEFDAVPFLAGKMETPVTVGVVVGDNALAYHLGFLSFQTDACYDENCSGQGLCDSSAGEAVCTCNDGFVPMGLECRCAPQCDGRECGGDNCDGSCGGCADGEVCDDGAGMCVPDPDATGTGTEGDDTMGTDSTGGQDESGSTDGTSAGATTSGSGSSSGSSGGMGSSSTG